jgi:hypothetical protein
LQRWGYPNDWSINTVDPDIDKLCAAQMSCVGRPHRIIGKVEEWKGPSLHLQYLFCAFCDHSLSLQKMELNVDFR